MAGVNDLVATPISSSEIRLDWTNQGNYTSISVEMWVENHWEPIGSVIPPSKETYTVSGLSGDTEYTFRLHTWELVGGDLVEYYSNHASAKTYPALSPPINVGGAAYGTHIDLFWENTSREGVTGIQIWRDSGSGYSLLTTVWGNAEAYRDTTANAAQNYSYKLRAVSGGGYSDYSTPITISQYGLPQDASDFSLDMAGSTWLKLRWTPPGSGSAPVAGFILEQNISGTYTEINRIPFGINEVYVRGLGESSSYTFRLKTYNAVGSSTGQTLNCSTVLESETPANKITGLLKKGRLNPILALKIYLDASTLVFLNREHTAFDSYAAYPFLMLPGEINFSMRIQEFWRPGLVGSGGSIDIFKPAELDLTMTGFLGRRAQLLFGDASFEAENEFQIIGGGVISGVSTGGGKITISWEDAARALNKTVPLETDMDGDFIPKIFGYAYAIGKIEDMGLKKIRFCAHRVYNITAVYKNSVAINSNQYTIDYERGAIYLDPSMSISDDDEFGADVFGYRNIANELIQKAPDVVRALFSDFLSFFDLAQLAWLRSQLTDDYNIGLIIKERENYIDIIRRIMSSGLIHAFNYGDRFFLTLGGDEFPFVADSSVYSSVDFSRLAEDLVSIIQVNYGYGSEIANENYLREEVSGAPGNASELQVSIYGNSYLAGLVIEAIKDYINRWTINLDLCYMPAGLIPGDMIKVGEMSVWVREIAANLSNYTARISGLIFSEVLEEITAGAPGAILTPEEAGQNAGGSVLIFHSRRIYVEPRPPEENEGRNGDIWIEYQEA